MKLLDYFYGMCNINQMSIKHKFQYINKSRCKKYALEYASQNKFHKFNRVSEEFLIEAESVLRSWMQRRIDSHPSIGKTLR